MRIIAYNDFKLWPKINQIDMKKLLDQYHELGSNYYFLP